MDIHKKDQDRKEIEKQTLSVMLDTKKILEHLDAAESYADLLLKECHKTRMLLGVSELSTAPRGTGKVKSMKDLTQSKVNRKTKLAKRRIAL